MKKFFYVLAPLVTALTIASVNLQTSTQEPATTQEANVSAANSCTTFATNLSNNLDQTPGNMFFSPYSIFSALSMAYAGAGGQTATEIKEVLGVTLAQNEYHQAQAQLAEWLNHDRLNQPNDSYQLTVANKLFVHDSFAIKQTFRDTITAHYGDAFESVDFAEQAQAAATINKWVANKTSDKIPTIVDSLPALTRLVLVNAIFKADWVRPFAADETHTAPFYTEFGCATSCSGGPVDVEMMQQTDEFAYFENDELQLIELPYNNSSLSMFVILPKQEGQGSPVMPDYSTFLSLIDQLEYKEVFLRLPKFTLETSYRLKDTLMAMGMTSAFDDANFSNLTDTNGLYLYDVIHKAFIEVAEEGTEAAAATGAIAGVKSLQTKAPLPKIFNADHPFLFVIHDTAADIPLFMGRYEG